MPVTPDEFRSALARFPSGITVVTTVDGEGVPQGLTVSAFCSVSLSPPLVLVCVQKGTASHRAVEESRAFVVNILGTGQAALSRQFALGAGDKFEGVRHREAIGGARALEDVLVNVECSLRDSFDGGDHSIFVGTVESVTVNDGEPLVYFHGNYRDLLGY